MPTPSVVGTPATGSSSTGTITANITITTDANSCLKVGIAHDDVAATVSSVTGAGCVFTQTGTIKHPNSERRVDLWAAPVVSTGAQTITVVLSAAVGCDIGVQQYKDANQTDPIPASTWVTNTGSSTTATVSGTAASGELGQAVAGTNRVFSAPTQTQEYNSGSNFSSAASWANGTGSSITHQWTLDVTGEWMMGFAIVKPVSGSGGGGPYQVLYGPRVPRWV